MRQISLDKMLLDRMALFWIGKKRFQIWVAEQNI
jgi:hypothetical protein